MENRARYRYVTLRPRASRLLTLNFRQKMEHVTDYRVMAILVIYWIRDSLERELRIIANKRPSFVPSKRVVLSQFLGLILSFLRSNLQFGMPITADKGAPNDVQLKSSNACRRV